MHQLRKVVNYSFMNYKGALVTRSAGKFVVLGAMFNTIEEAKNHVDNSFLILKNSIQCSSMENKE